MPPSRIGRLVDAHLHLQDPRLEGRVEELLEEASRRGVTRWVVNGTHEGDWPRVAALHERFPGRVIPCVGLHPWKAPGRSERWLQRLEEWLDRLPAVIGEVGLDRVVEPRDEAVQEEVLRAQLALARSRMLPVCVHVVRAWGWFLEMLRDEPPLTAGFLLHGYTGSAELVGELLERGGWFSFGAGALAPGRKKAAAALRAVPAERLLVETDAPDMPPPSEHRPLALEGAGGEAWNHPGNLPAIVEGLAALRGEPAGELAESSRQAAAHLFAPVWPGEGAR